MSGLEKVTKGHFAKLKADRTASDVHSARPTVITGSGDATEHKATPYKKPVKDWRSSANEVARLR
ncbi:hypothetical protein ACCT19_30515 [Rhizobium ruizarguesonis]